MHSNHLLCCFNLQWNMQIQVHHIRRGTFLHALNINNSISVRIASFNALCRLWHIAKLVFSAWRLHSPMLETFRINYMNCKIVTHLCFQLLLALIFQAIRVTCFIILAKLLVTLIATAVYISVTVFITRARCCGLWIKVFITWKRIKLFFSVRCHNGIDNCL